jgi:hypothetical protein
VASTCTRGSGCAAKYAVAASTGVNSSAASRDSPICRSIATIDAESCESVFVTNRTAWPASRRAATAASAPGTSPSPA